jgi:hypothetical protein
MTAAEELKKLKELRAKIISALDGAVENFEIESYSFGDGDGNQNVRRRSPKELMQTLDELDKKIEALERKMQGGGIRSFGTDRHGA